MRWKHFERLQISSLEIHRFSSIVFNSNDFNFTSPTVLKLKIANSIFLLVCWFFSWWWSSCRLFLFVLEFQERQIFNFFFHVNHQQEEGRRRLFNDYRLSIINLETNNIDFEFSLITFDYCQFIGLSWLF